MSRADQKRKAQEDPPAPIESKTAARIDQREKGDLQAKDSNYSLPGTPDEMPLRQAAAIRQQQAKTLCATVARMISTHGSVRMASQLQLLRRELSQCHEVLGALKSESDFLSIVVLVELELGNKDWIAITKAELQTLKNALQVGASEPCVTFDHYNQIARLLIAGGWNIGPTLEIDSATNEVDEHVH